MRIFFLSLLVLVLKSANASTVFSLTPGVPIAQSVESASGLTWEKGAGRYGGTALKITAPSATGELRIQVFAEPQPLLVPDRLRLEAWLKPQEGAIQVSLVLYNLAEGSERERFPLSAMRERPPAPPPEDRRSWKYRACDIPLEKEVGGLGYNLEVTALRGTAWVDALQVVGADSLVTNGDFTDKEVPNPPGATGKDIPRGWRRAYSGTQQNQAAEGAFTIKESPDGSRLAIRKSHGEFVLSAEPILLPQGVTRFTARATVVGPRPDPTLTLVVCQHGRKGVLRENATNLTLPWKDGIALSTGLLEADPGADRLLCFVRFPEQAGEYFLHSVQILPISPLDPGLQIIHDQVGYDTGQTLRFIAASSVFPASGLGSFALVDKEALRIGGTLEPLGRAMGQGGVDWGRYYFEGSIDSPPPGAYALEVEIGSRTAEVDGVAVGPTLHLHQTGELAYQFFHYQRCGFELPGWHGLCHMDDARLPDGSHVNLSGGYHNAGDFHKHMGDNTPVAVYGMASAYDACKAFFDGFDSDGNNRPDLLDEILWGADWLLKMVDPKTGRFWMNVTNDIDYFGIPEGDTDGIIGTGDDRVIGATDPIDLGGFALAAWAVLARNMGETKYLGAAERTWRAYEQRILSSREPRLLVAALELYRTTGKEDYRKASYHLTHNLLAIQNPAGWFAASPGGAPVFRIVDEGTIPAALASYVLAFPSADLAEEVRAALRRYYLLIFRMTDNPFGILRHYSEPEAFYFKKREDWFGGSNSAYCSLAWASSLAARVFVHEPDLHRQLQRLATDQMHWIVGMNPLSLCMFEGRGNTDRIRFHHLYAEIPGHPRGAVPGAIPNGIVREPGNTDRPWFDLRSGEGSPPGAESAEPWLPHNAYYLLMLSASVQNLD